MAGWFLRPRAFALALAPVIVACGGGGGKGDGEATADDTTSATTTGTGTTGGSTEETGDTSYDPPAGQWDPPIDPPACELDDGAPLLEQALTQAGLTPATFRFSEADFQESVQYNNGVLGGDFAFSWLWEVRADAARSGCFEAATAGVLGDYLGAAHPVASMIRHLADTIDRSPDDEPPFGQGADFDEGLARLCETVASSCDGAEGELPDDLREALGPLVWAMGSGIDARLAMDQTPGGSPTFWRDNGGNHLLLDAGPVPSPSDPDTRTYLLGQDSRNPLYRAAAQIAHAIEDVDWSQFVGRMDVEFSLETNAGWILVRDGGDDLYEVEDRDVLLLVDLGGNDEHLDEVASNRSAANAVSVVIDLAGADTYHYAEIASQWDQDGLLPADEAGRAAPDGTYGSYSLSTEFRQGAARNGIAMLFDLGGAADHYQSLRGSQGYAHQGVGVLYDDGGDDTYLAEANAQGSAQFGIALLVDAGDGIDSFRAFSYAQGFGYAAAAGALVNEAGADHYDCDNGDPMHGGLPVYYSPQRSDNGNTSMCQGAGFGARNDSSTVSSLSGGLGILRDVAGNDQYDASVFAQGTGYWEGVGVLSDGAGDDRYDAFWYVQGGVAHYAVGILADDGDGADRFNLDRPSQSVNLGSGHDYSLGVLLNEGGADEYHITGLSTGASNCNGIGLFVDNGGDDLYEAVSDLSSGVGNVSNECISSRPDAVSIGVMIDAGGTDTYQYPMGGHPDFIAPAEGSLWGYARFGLESEHGGGVDGDDESGIH